MMLLHFGALRYRLLADLELPAFLGPRAAMPLMLHDVRTPPPRRAHAVMRAERRDFGTREAIEATKSRRC